MGAYAIRAAYFAWPAPNKGVDVGAPTFVSGTASALAVLITFSEALRASPHFLQVTATVNGAPRAVSAISVSGSVLTLTIAGPTLTAGQAVVASYLPNATPAQHLADNTARANEVPAQTFPPIIAT